MATPTPYLSLTRDDPTENYSVGRVNANSDKIDAETDRLNDIVVDLQNNNIICTSTTRPASPTLGDTIYETNTGIQRIWNGTRWRWLAGSTIAGLFPIPTQSLTTATGTNLVLNGAVGGAGSNDPEGIFTRHADTKGIVVSVGGWYIPTLEMSWAINSPNYTAWIAYPTALYVGQVPAPGGSTSITTRPIQVLAGGVVRPFIYNYGATTNLSGGTFSLIQVCEA